MTRSIQGENWIAQQIFSQPLEMMLFTNSSLPDVVELANLSEPVGGGYARIPLPANLWEITNGHVSRPFEDFIANSDGYGGGDIYGVGWVTTGASPVLVRAWLFDNPVTDMDQPFARLRVNLQSPNLVTVSTGDPVPAIVTVLGGSSVNTVPGAPSGGGGSGFVAGSTPPPEESQGPATLFVKPAHPAASDDYTKAEVTAETPWATLTRALYGSASHSTPNAAEAVGPADVLEVSGDHSGLGLSDHRNPFFKPINSGSPGACITIRAVGTVNLTIAVGNGPIFGTYQTSWCAWVGDFRASYPDESNAREDSGICSVRNSSHVWIDGATITGLPITTWASNWNGVRCEATSYVTVRNCTISGFEGGVTNSNACGIMMYNADHFTAEQNEIHSCNSGIWWKGYVQGGGPQTSGIARRNIVRDINGTGINFSYVNYGSQGEATVAYQNIVYRCASAFGFGSYQQGIPNQVRVVNNTAWECHHEQYPQLFGGALSISPSAQFYGDDLMFRNNIGANNTNAVYPGGDHTIQTLTEMCDFGNNVYWGYDIFINTDYGQTLAETLADWVPAAGTQGEIEANPQFVDAEGGDFRLQAGSEALTVGRDVLQLLGGSASAVLPAGAFITSDQSDPIGPQTPGV